MDIQQSSAIHKFLDFRYMIRRFETRANQRRLKSKIETKFHHPRRVKYGCRIVEMSDWHFRAGPST